MITKHAKKRMTQRFAIAKKRIQNNLFDLALHKGNSPAYYRDCSFRDYLIKLDKKQKYTHVKVYEGKIFIHRNKSLITAFNIPAKWGDTDSFLNYNRIENKLTKKIGKKYHTDTIVLKDVSRFFKKDNLELKVIALYIKGKLVDYGLGKDLNVARIDALNNALAEESRIIVK